jgi:hypothetical protein
MPSLRAAIAATIVLAVGTLAGATQARADHARLRLRGFAVNMSGVGPASGGMLDIVIERWSTDAERARLRAVLAKAGPGAMMATLQRTTPRAGYIRSPYTMGWTVHYAREQPTPDGGRRVVIVTQRPLSFRELRHRPRSVDYQLTFAEIRLDRHGRGQGTLFAGAQMSWDHRTDSITIVGYGTGPVRITRISID